MLFASADVVDGTGSPARVADVRVRDGRIAEIGSSLVPGDDEFVVDAAGLVLAPGFIDMHAHSDLELLRPGAHEAKLRQGVTTEVIGQDGLSYAPVDDDTLRDVRTRIAAWHGDLDDDAFTWRDVAGYLDRLDVGAPVNAAYLVPQGNLRMLAVGHAACPAAPAELDRMRGLLGDGLAAGAFGMSSGLTYTPGMHATTGELTALCRVVAAHGGYWSPHTRGYGGGALAAYREVIEIAREAGCPVHLTHATMNFAANRGRAGELLDLVDAAVADGVDVTLDTYPYLAGATTLSALLPSDVQTGGADAVLAALAEPASRERVRRVIEDEGSDGAHGELIDWTTIQISGVSDPLLESCVGATVAELVGAAELDAPATPFDAAAELLRRDRLRTGILMHVGDEQNVRTVMAHPRHMGGSDGILVGSRPHPRGWGTFPRFVSGYRDVLSLEEWVRHLSGSPARRLGLADRGEVRVGAVADLVLFDPRTFADTATYAAPRRTATGVAWVLIGGEPAIAAGAVTPARAGRALRRCR